MYTILLIDDEEDFLMINEELLSQKNYKVVTAQTQQEGLALLKKYQPHLVVLDVMMSYNYEGFDIARKIREEYKMTDIPIIVLTSIREKLDIPYHFTPDKHYLPVDVFVEKPIKPNKLLQLIDELLGNKDDLSDNYL